MMGKAHHGLTVSVAALVTAWRFGKRDRNVEKESNKELV